MDERVRQLSDYMDSLGLEPQIPEGIDPTEFSKAAQEQQRRERQRSGSRTGETPDARRQRGRGASLTPLPMVAESAAWVQPAGAAESMQAMQLRQASAMERRRTVEAHGVHCCCSLSRSVPPPSVRDQLLV